MVILILVIHGKKLIEVILTEKEHKLYDTTFVVEMLAPVEHKGTLALEGTIEEAKEKFQEYLENNFEKFVVTEFKEHEGSMTEQELDDLIKKSEYTLAQEQETQTVQ